MIGRRALAPFLALAFPPAGARAQLLNPGAPTLAERDGLIGPDQPPPPPGPEALAWQAAVVANGGTVSAARLQIVQNFIGAEQAAGTWALTDDYWGLWGESAAQALTSLKQRRLATAAGSPSFTADRGYTFDGVDDQVSTGFLPATHCISATAGNARLAMYERLDFSSANSAVGSQNNASVSMLLNPRSGLQTRSKILASELSLQTLPVANAQGFVTISRQGTATMRTFKNGAALPDFVATTLGATLPTISITIGALNGTAFRQCAPGLACIGAPFSDSQEAAQYANVQAWGAAIGANV